MKNIAIIGTQWGDEGKGKMVDTLAQNPKIKAVVRFQGGNNAGHTVVVKDQKYALHLIPAGILHPAKTCVIGNNVIINPEILTQELDHLQASVGHRHAKLLISEKAHLIMPWHLLLDQISGGKIGTTQRGIGPTYMDATARRGIRLLDTGSKQRFTQRVKEELVWNKCLINLMLDHHRFSKYDRSKLKLRTALNLSTIINTYWRLLNRLKKDPKITIGNVSLYLNGLLINNQPILFEGAQATLLDIAHGTYPFVTSSNPTLGGLFTGTGVRPRNLKVIGVAKAYTTRVGHGPFPTELFDQTGEKLRQVGNEYGTTTGRPRRCGWLDLTIINYAKLINGLDSLAMPKLDVLSGINPLKIAVAYQIGSTTTDIFEPDFEKLSQVKVIYHQLPGWSEDITSLTHFANLPKPAQNYLQFIEKRTALPIELIGVGPRRDQIIVR